MVYVPIAVPNAGNQLVVRDVEGLNQWYQMRSQILNLAHQCLVQLGPISFLQESLVIKTVCVLAQLLKAVDFPKRL